MDTEKKSTIWTRGFIIIFFVNTTLQMGQNMMTALIPRYTNMLGAAASIVGLVGGLFAATALLMRPFAGPAVDHFNRKKLYLLSIAIIGASYVGFGISRSVGMVIVSRLLQGCGMGFTGPLGLALASEFLPLDKMASGIGIFSLAQTVGQAIGPTIGLALVDLFGYNMTFFICAGVVAAAAVLTMLLDYHAPEKDERFTISLEKVAAKEAIVPSVILFFFSVGWVAISSFVVIFGEAQGVQGMGLFFTAYAVALMVTRPSFGRIADERGIAAVVVPACILYAIAFIIMSFSSSLPMFLIAAVVAAFGYGGAQPSLQALCMSSVPDERRGAGANTSYIGIDAGQLIGGYLGGSLVTLGTQIAGTAIGGYSFMYRAMIVPCALALLIFWMNRTHLAELESKED